MPVVISILNSCTGLAAAAAGFVLDNHALIVSGTLVGASGTLLTQLMCKAMNRSLANVLFGARGRARPRAASRARPARLAKRPVRDVSVEDAAVLLANVQSLIIVPGYGLAVAQAQHVVRELADLLARRGVDVKYAIHPVAGRMPGHMNVLLAEANVPYSQLFDLDQINSEFERTDVALVIGANDVVNPAARARQGEPDLRHADPRRRQGAARRAHEAQRSTRASRASTTSCTTTRRRPCSSATPRRS